MDRAALARLRAEQSGGISGGNPFYDFVVRGLGTTLESSQILDLGCGKGQFGTYLHARYRVRPSGIDLMRHQDFAETDYKSFSLANLDESGNGISERQWQCIFAIGLIEYLANPRELIRKVASALVQGGKFIITSPNPISLRSLFSALRTGQFSAFREFTNAASITPTLPNDACRMLREAGFESVRTDYSDSGLLFGRSPLKWQNILPFARGRWFSDDYRVQGTLCIK